LIFNNKKYFIDDRIFTGKFFCNLKLCKGGCCTIKSQLGAPLNENEVEIIKNISGKIEKYITKENIKVIRDRDFYFKKEGKIYLNNVNDEDCVFSYITEGVAKCAFEKAYKLGESDFKKPLSCELFPIRVYGDEKNVLRYEKMNECEDAIEKGTEENTSVFEFVKEAIVRAYGKEFYNNLKYFIKENSFTDV
jgi:hypothetical protein